MPLATRIKNQPNPPLRAMSSWFLSKVERTAATITPITKPISRAKKVICKVAPKPFKRERQRSDAMKFK